MFLGTYEEVIEMLKKVRREGDYCIVVFTFEREVLLPADAISVDRLRRMQGKQIGLLNCDGAYKVRYIKNNERGEKKICVGKKIIRKQVNTGSNTHSYWRLKSNRNIRIYGGSL